MKKLTIAASLLALAIVPLSAIAQEEEAQNQIISATYFYCPVAKQENADKVVEEKFKPIYDAAVEAGTINAWGWMAHLYGGKWRRVLYFSSDNLDASLDAGTALNKATGEVMGDDTTFGEACPSHDDYIWEAVAGNNSDGERGVAGFSTYFICDSGGEERADEIMKENLASTYDELVENGNLVSWGWISHWVGGKYRRALTMTGISHKATIQARDHAISVIFAEGNEAGAEFGKICSDHTDYMWDIQFETP